MFFESTAKLEATHRSFFPFHFFVLIPMLMMLAACGQDAIKTTLEQQNQNESDVGSLVSPAADRKIQDLYSLDSFRDVLFPALTNDSFSIGLEKEEKVSLSASSKTIILPVDGETTYILSGTGYSSDSSQSTEALIQFDFLDNGGNLITDRYDYASFSTSLGTHFFYIPTTSEGAPIKREFLAPSNAKAIVLGFRAWAAKGQPRISSKWKFESSEK